MSADTSQKQGTSRCTECGATFLRASSRGRPPKLCDQCDARKNGARRERQRKKKPTTTEPSASPFFVLGQGPDDTRPDPSTWSERLAVGLSLSSDLDVAAQSVGMSFLTQAQLKSLAAQAQRHQDLIDGKSSATAKQLHAALALASLELRARATSLSPGVLASSVKALTTSISEFSGGSQRIFSQVIIEAPRGHGEGLTQADCAKVADKSE